MQKNETYFSIQHSTTDSLICKRQDGLSSVSKPHPNKGFLYFALVQNKTFLWNVKSWKQKRIQFAGEVILPFLFISRICTPPTLNTQYKKVRVRMKVKVILSLSLPGFLVEQETVETLHHIIFAKYWATIKIQLLSDSLRVIEWVIKWKGDMLSCPSRLMSKDYTRI